MTTDGDFLNAMLSLSNLSYVNVISWMVVCRLGVPTVSSSSRLTFTLGFLFKFNDPGLKSIVLFLLVGDLSGYFGVRNIIGEVTLLSVSIYTTDVSVFAVLYFGGVAIFYLSDFIVTAPLRTIYTPLFLLILCDPARFCCLTNVMASDFNTIGELILS